MCSVSESLWLPIAASFVDEGGDLPSRVHQVFHGAVYDTFYLVGAASSAGYLALEETELGDHEGEEIEYLVSSYTMPARRSVPP